MSKKPLDVKVKGVPVRVYYDGDGRPLHATTVLQRPDDPDHERHFALAATVAFDVTGASEKRQRQSDDASAKSAKKRDEESRNHPANTWLALAYAEHPGHGRKKLAHAARSLAAKAHDEAAKAHDKATSPEDKKILAEKRDELSAHKLDEITEDRARQFLERQRNSGGQDENRG